MCSHTLVCVCVCVCVCVRVCVCYTYTGSSHARPRTPMRLATEFSPLGVSECLSALAIFELQVRGSVNASPSSWVSECLSALAIFELQVRARLTACPSSDREEEEEASDEPSSSLRCTRVSKEAYYVSAEAYFCQKKPTSMAKDLIQTQKSPKTNAKEP